jgi:type IV pilus assembly protein PilC
MKFSYQGYDKLGKPITGVVDAASIEDASEQARRKGVFVLRVDAAGKSSAGAGRVTARRGGAGLKQLRALSGFTRQLAVLVSTGTPVVQALEAVGRQTQDSRWRVVIDNVRVRVEQGAPLSEAMEAHPRCFDRVACSLVRAGEAGGQLPDLLNRLASLTRQTVKIRSALTGAMVYPTLLIGVAIGVLSIMIGFVLPRFEGLFKTLNVPLPPSTKVLMDISTFVKTYWPVVIASLALIVGGLIAWLRSQAGTDLRDRAIVSLPQIGSVARGFATARLARLLGVLIESKVPLLDSLQLTRDATTSKLYAGLLTRAEEAVTRGENVSAVFAASTLVTPAITEALRSGERTGRIGPVLLEVANFLDEDNEVILKSVTSLIEPLILIALGIAVGFVALSMFLPLFDLTSATQGGPPPGATP